MRGSMIAGGVFLLAGLNGNRQPILARGQRACREPSKGAGRIVCFVEVYYGFPVCRHWGIKVATRAVSLSTGRLVCEHYEKFLGPLLYHHVELVSGAAYLEADRAGRLLVLNHSEDVGDRDGLRRVVGHERSFEPPAGVDRVIFDSLETNSIGVVAVPDTKSQPVTPLNNVKTE